MPAKLPILELTLEVYRTVWRLRAHWAAYLLLPVGLVVATAALEHALVGPLLYTAGLAADSVTSMIVSAVIAFPVAIAWHRLALLDRPLPVRWLPFAWRWREWKYVLLTTAFLLATLLVWIPGVVGAYVAVFVSPECCRAWLPVALDARHTDPFLANATFAIILTELVTLPLFCRFLLVFPPVAVDARATLRASWRITRGNGFRLAVVYVLSGYWILFVALWAQAAGWLPGTPGAADWVVFVVYTAAGYVAMALAVVALSLAYRRLSGWDGTGSPPDLTLEASGARSAARDGPPPTASP